ncbi:MAG: NfeD family protein [Bacteroidales bacterium]|nr:NfeD family protein [Bacteroidales bacterium]
MSTLLVSLLVLAGFLLLFVELLLVPGIGVPGFAGLAALVAACYFAFTRFGTLTGVVVTSCVSLALLALVIYVLRAKTWKRFALRDEIRATALAEDPLPETGTRGVTLTRLAPVGTARFDGRDFEVKSDTNDMVDPGTAVTVVRSEGNKIIVKPL